jgi:hypothetical protein
MHGMPLSVVLQELPESNALVLREMKMSESKLGFRGLSLYSHVVAKINIP